MGIHPASSSFTFAPNQSTSEVKPGEVFALQAKFGNTNNIYLKISKILAAFGVLLLAIAWGPSVYYRLSGGIEANTRIIKETSQAEIEAVNVKSPYQPKLDTTLPQTASISIPSVRIETEINEATSDNFEEALKKGVWRVSDFGTPFKRDLPIILTAHRFGYLAWSVPYRLKNSFYNLPKVSGGDIIEITYRQRKYVFEVYKEEEGEKITDYSADLILYTCKDLNSPIRIFRYARLLEI